MSISLPLEKIARGNCILFLGAGFSRESTSIRNENIRDGYGLTQQMLDICNIDDKEDYDIETASDLYTRTLGESSIIDLIYDNFFVKPLLIFKRLL